MDSSHKYEVLFTFPYKTLKSYNKSELTKMCRYHQVRSPTNTRKDMVQCLEYKENKRRSKIIVYDKSYYMEYYGLQTFQKTYEDIYRIVYMWNKVTVRYTKTTGKLETNSGTYLFGRNILSINRWINVIHYYETYHLYIHLLHFLHKDLLIK